MHQWECIQTLLRVKAVIDQLKAIERTPSPSENVRYGRRRSNVPTNRRHHCSRSVCWKGKRGKQEGVLEGNTMLLSKKIRLEASEQDAQTLELKQGKCRGLYNWWIMKLRNGERWPGWEEAKKSLQASKEYDPELKFVYGKCLAEVYFRLEGAMKAFRRRVKNGEKPGFPRVRPRHCFFTLIYPAMYIKVEGMSLRLPTGGKGKTCSGCGHKQHMPLWKRTYRCPDPDCRLVMDRDENSAVNILKRYFARLELSLYSEHQRHCRS